MKNWMKEESGVLFPTVLMYSFALVTAPLFLTLSIVFILLNLPGCVCFIAYSHVMDGVISVSVTAHINFLLILVLKPFTLSLLFITCTYTDVWSVFIQCQRGIVKGEYQKSNYFSPYVLRVSSQRAANVLLIFLVHSSIQDCISFVLLMPESEPCLKFQNLPSYILPRGINAWYIYKKNTIIYYCVELLSVMSHTHLAFQDESMVFCDWKLQGTKLDGTVNNKSPVLNLFTKKDLY